MMFTRSFDGDEEGGGDEELRTSPFHKQVFDNLTFSGMMLLFFDSDAHLISE